MARASSFRPGGRGLLTLCLYVVLGAGGFGGVVLAAEPIPISSLEAGERLGHRFDVWHDPTGEAGLAEALDAVDGGEFSALERTDSTGLQPGAFWSHFSLHNPTARPVTLHLEYVDHQLIQLTAHRRPTGGDAFTGFFDAALDGPFAERPVAHHRFVVPVEVAGGETLELLLRFGSDGHGFVFPDLRLWAPEQLRHVQSIELVLIGFMTGSLLLMTIIVIVAGFTTGRSLFHTYAVYAATKLILWPTMLGFTHQFVLRDHFHWSLISLSGAATLASGIWFARAFLESRRTLPHFDWVLLAMLVNAVVLMMSALTGPTSLSVLTITIALLLTPLMPVAGFLRWRQGSQGAAVFGLAWVFLMMGLFSQALRDLGFLPHTLTTYYWPIVASYAEMVVIVAAIGVDLRDLGEEKRAAEREARTDALTGIDNRRSFMLRAEDLMQGCRRQGHGFHVVMIDIDHFKRVNDDYGHDVGDLTLTAFAATISSQIRDLDVFGRLGGEEFGLALSGSTQSTMRIAERLRESVKAMRIDTERGPLRVAASVGVAQLTHEASLGELLRKADKALYEAKRTGRDRVIMRDDGAFRSARDTFPASESSSSASH